MKTNFLKYEACGNDFILIDLKRNNLNLNNSEMGNLAHKLCNRNFSIGANDVLYIDKSTVADGKMLVFEPDGTEADMCGNGIRCVASYLSSELSKDSILIETKAGIKDVKKVNNEFRVNMGKINMDPVFFKRYLNFEPGISLENMNLAFNSIGNKSCSIIYTGEPNIVFIEKSIDDIDINLWGRNVSLDRKKFPVGICTVLVEKLNEDTIKARFFEKGVYEETYACGTGSTAAAYISKLLKLVSSDKINVKVKGGIIKIEPGTDTYMTGEAKFVYEGSIDMNNLID